MKNRREFLRQTATFGLTAGLLPSLAAADPKEDHVVPKKRPNILFIYTDDQRWDAMGVVQKEQGEKARFPWLKTPNMDRLAQEGVRFRNAFVVNSICSPSRASFLTGQYSHHNGVTDNVSHFPVENVTYASLLTEAGYATGYFGKWHMGQQSGKRPGFTTSASYIGQGQYFDCPFEIDGVARPTKGWVDTVGTDFAIEFIRKNSMRPFLAVVGFKAVHEKREPRPEDRELYDGVQVGVPGNRYVLPPFKESLSKSASEKVKPSDDKQHPINDYGRQYFQTLNGADHNLGRLLDAIDELGLRENTLVVFTSDNGYFMGEHDLGDKRYAYEESLRIPLLVRYPKLTTPTKTADQMVLNIDFAPTVLDLARIPIPPSMQGKSWKPLLTESNPKWRQQFYYEYHTDRQFPAVPRVQALRTITAKFIVYPGHEWVELYDLAKDPLETRNLAKDPEATALLDALSKRFLDEQQRVNVTPGEQPAQKESSDHSPVYKGGE
jgi:arylsulfatase A-like enzyme